jgi:hypothetical protein
MQQMINLKFQNMKKINALLSIMFMLLITKVSAQEKNFEEGTTIEVEIVQNGKVAKEIGYLIVFDMQELKSLYSAVVIEKNLIENAKQVVVHFPMKNGEQSKYQIENISKYLFTVKSNNLAIIRFSELKNTIENQIINENLMFVPEDAISEFSFPLDIIKLKELKESLEKSMIGK